MLHPKHPTADLSSNNGQFFTTRELFSEAFQIIRGQYLLYFVLCNALLMISVLSPLAVLIGPSLACIYKAIHERVTHGNANLRLLPFWFSNSLDAILAYLMMLASCFLFLVPTSFILYYVALNWDAILRESGLSEALLLALIVGVAPTLATVQITFCLPFLFTFPYLAQSDQGSVDAIKHSIQVTTSNIFVVLRVAATVIVLQLTATAILVIPGLMMVPINFAMVYRMHQRLATKATMA